MSASSTVYLVTGANRAYSIVILRTTQPLTQLATTRVAASPGIGLGIASLLLARPDTTVVATSRQPPAPGDALSALAASPAVHPTSRLVRLELDVASPASLSTLAARLASEHAISALDVVISNAGAAAAGAGGVLSAGLAERARRDWEVNAGGVVGVFRAVWPLLEASGKPAAERKFASVSSSVGSIGLLGRECFPMAAYGMSKAAANYFVRMVAAELKGRWVKTSMGQMLADELGVPEPPLTVQESARGVIEQVDALTLENSGRFVTQKGEEIPW
ncbi:hypothetical protein VTJ83DRAFT_4505 [Remersonia thermophila]|uniref:NAD(P)-binding protein n=1 Tax=Remersonia thermophila TaxID=72144 RepID=A0ABR4DA57_9PEZI